METVLMEELFPHFFLLHMQGIQKTWPHLVKNLNHHGLQLMTDLNDKLNMGIPIFIWHDCLENTSSACGVLSWQLDTSGIHLKNFIFILHDLFQYSMLTGEKTRIFHHIGLIPNSLRELWFCSHMCLWFSYTVFKNLAVMCGIKNLCNSERWMEGTF